MCGIVRRTRGEAAGCQGGGRGGGRRNSNGPSPLPSPRYAGRGQTVALIRTSQSIPATSLQCSWDSPALTVSLAGEGGGGRVVGGADAVELELLPEVLAGDAERLGGERLL